MIDAIINMSEALNKLTAETPETAIVGIQNTTTVLTDVAKTVKAQLDSPTCLSQNTYTK